MTYSERRSKRRYNDRRQHNNCFVPGPGFVERRGDDRFAATLKAIFDQHMEDTISDEQIQRVVEPAQKKIWDNKGR